MHHAFVDKVWAEWQIRHPSRARHYRGRDHRRRRVNLNNRLNMDRVKNVIGFPFTLTAGNRRVREMMDTRDWCYYYSNGIVPEARSLFMTGNSSDIDTTGIEASIDDRRSSALSGIPNMLAPIANIFKRSVTPNNIVTSYRPKRRKEYHGSPYNPKTPSCDDRDDDFNIRKFSPIPDHQLIANGLNVTNARKFERISHAFTDYVNSVGGYVSDCAIVFQKAKTYMPMSDEDYQARKLERRTLVREARRALGLPKLRSML